MCPSNTTNGQLHLSAGVPCFRHPFVAGGKKKSRDTYRSKATAQVNDRYFVSDVTSYSAGNFTAVTGQQWSRGKLCGYEQRQIKCVGSTRRCKHFPPLDVGFSHGRLCSHDQIYSSSKQSAYLFDSWTFQGERLWTIRWLQIFFFFGRLKHILSVWMADESCGSSHWICQW